MEFRWFGTCAQCGEKLAVKPRYGPERPGGTVETEVKCGSCNELKPHGFTPIQYTRLSIIIRK